MLGLFFGFGFEDKVTEIYTIKFEGQEAFVFDCKTFEILPGFFGLDYMITCQSKLQLREPFHLAEGHKKYLRNVGYKKLSRYKARRLGGGLEFSASKDGKHDWH